MATTEDYQGLMQRWKSYVGAQENLRADRFIGDFLRLRDEFTAMKTETARTAITQAPAFNIFNILHLERDELRHSVFLRTLFDPMGGHGQGMLFLESFLLFCLKKYPEFPILPDQLVSNRWEVFAEYPIQTGRIDIVISNSSIGCLFVIENKVDAYEQSRQIERYAQWMQQNTMTFPYQAIIFLTTTGYPAISAGGVPYFRLSYRRDVSAWLGELLTNDQIKAPGVKEVVRQYQSTIARL